MAEGNLWRAHACGMAEFLEADEALVPVNISLFGADGIEAEALSECLLRHHSRSLETVCLGV